MHHDPLPPRTALEPLRLACVLAHVLPAADVLVTAGHREVRVGPKARGGQLPLPALREAVGTALASDDGGAVRALLGAPVAHLRPRLDVGHAAAGARGLGGGLYEARWAGRTTCLFATVLAERDARDAVRDASTYPPALEGLPVSALGLEPRPQRVAVVTDQATATTVFGLDRAAGADAEVTALVRAAMTAAAAACLVAELRTSRRAHHLPPER